MIAKKALVIGSGASIRKGNWHVAPDKLPLWSAIKNELTVGINWCFRYFVPTVLMYGDYEFYIPEKENLGKLPLVFGMQDGYYGRDLVTSKEIFHLENNVYLLPNRKVLQIEGKEVKYHGVNAWELGFYTRFFSGILGINLAIALGCTEIYLLGFDATETEGRTHFYQDEFEAWHKAENGKLISGVGNRDDGRGYRTSLYNQDFNEKYIPLAKELDRIKILNVSLNSGITVFPKISYKDFYARIKDKKEYKNQNVLRKQILNKYKESYYD